MAAPHVAGAWAVFKSRLPNASLNQVLSSLTGTGVPIRDARNGITKPRIQLDAAIGAGSACVYQSSRLRSSFLPRVEV